MKKVTEFIFVVKKTPKREAVLKYYKSGRRRVVVEITQKQMDELMTGKLKEK